MKLGIRERLASLCWEGLTPDTIALSIVVGFLFGIMPFFGLPTPLCALAAIVLRVNLPMVQAVNYLVYPLQIAMVVPFYRLGERIYRVPGVIGWSFWGTALHTFTAWLCISVPAALVLYFTLRCLFHFRGLGMLQWKRSPVPVVST